MLSWFGRKKRRQAAESLICWRSRESKYLRIAADLIARREVGEAVILVAHFDQTRSELLASFETDGVSWIDEPNPERLVQDATATWRQYTDQVVIVHSGIIEDPPDAATDDVDPTHQFPVHVAVAEVYPTAARDDRVRAFAARLSRQCSLCFHVSLEDAVLKHGGLASPKTVAVVERLGFTGDAGLEHPIIRQSIARVQRSNAKRALGEDPTTSAEQWFTRNLRH